MERKSKKRFALAVLLICLTVTLSAVGIFTFAKYRTQLDGSNQTATVAKWAFGTDNANTFTFSLANTYTASTLVSDKIAPGTQGELTFAVSNANTEVGTQYTIALSNTNAPTNIKFYSDSACTTELVNNELTGTLAPNAASQTVKIYWKWAYETGTVTNGVATGDSADTTDGVAANTMTVTATITGVQVEPTVQP